MKRPLASWRAALVLVWTVIAMASPTTTSAWVLVLPSLLWSSPSRLLLPNHVVRWSRRRRSKEKEEEEAAAAAADEDDYERPLYYKPRQVDASQLIDLTGGRPGAIVETEEQLAAKERMFQEIETGVRTYPDFFNEYGRTADEEAAYDIDDPDALDAAELGRWTIQDLRAKFDYEWDPHSNDPDPNRKDPRKSYVEKEIDDDGVEVGYDPIFGPSNPFDRRAIAGSVDSFMIDEATRNDDMLEPQFAPDDPERAYNEEVVQFRRSLNLLETYVDPFLEMEVPRRVAKWHGYPEPMYFEPKNFTNNRFTKPEDLTDFDSMDPYRARVRAVELARAKNAEWLPDGVSQEWHREQRRPYENCGTLIGTLRPGPIDADIAEAIQPVLKVLGSCVKLLSIEGPEQTVFRFHYYGLMKNKFGMQCWTETLIKDCGVDVTGVVFETGFRKRDHAYDGGGYWNGPSL